MVTFRIHSEFGFANAPATTRPLAPKSKMARSLWRFNSLYLRAVVKSWILNRYTTAKKKENERQALR